MKKFIMQLWSDESGQDLAEYAMLLVLVAIVVLVALGPFADAVSGGFNTATGALFDGPGGS
jgi:pilus assembly protein Flp/PilA